MTIVERDQVRAAVERALQLDQQHDEPAAIASVAQSLCLPAETVAAIVYERDEVSE